MLSLPSINKLRSLIIYTKYTVLFWIGHARSERSEQNFLEKY